MANSFLTGKMCKYPEFQIMEKTIVFFQIKCAVSDSGFPHSNGVRWLHNGHEMKGKTSFLLSFNHAQVSSEGNYSCVPFNRVGMAQPAGSSIRLHSPPTFVQKLPAVSGN